MLKILTEIDKTKGFRTFGDDFGDNFHFDHPCILSGASRYLEVSLSDIVPNSSGLGYLKMPFIFIPIINIVKVPVAGVSDEISDMVPGILKEMQNSKILEDIDLAVKAVNDFLEDPVPVDGTVDTRGYPSYKLSGNLDYYHLDKHYTDLGAFDPWPGLHQIKWFGQELYICTNLRGDNCRLLILTTQVVRDQELLVKLMNYKYAFKRYGIKTTSN